ncbi:MAG: 1,4-dihydroxy-2-naphthoate octaprenyltransferase [Ktedonobacteraceae bacterium]
MQSEDLAPEDDEKTITVSRSKREPINTKKGKNSPHVVTAESVQAEEVPTIPLESLKTLSTLEPAVSVRSVGATQSVRLPAPLVVQPSEYRRSLGEWLQVWWEGIRPGYLPLAIMPVLVGSTLAWTQGVSPRTPFGSFHFFHFIAVLFAVVALQVGANLVNDYYDYIKGIDTSNPLGPGGLIQQGLIRPTRVLNFGLILLALGSLMGALVALAGGLYVYLFGLIGLLCAYFYSATARSLSSLALGELISFCVFGPLLTLGAYMVQTGGFANRAALVSVLLYSLPLGLLATAVVHVNDMRDVESDVQARKRTLASVQGLRWGRVEYILLVVGAYAIIVALGLPHGAPHLVLITLWTLPILLVAITGVMRADMPASLHGVMRETLKLVTYFALLLIAALILSALIIVLPHLPSHILPI